MKNKFLKDALSLGLSSFKNSLFMKMNLFMKDFKKVELKSFFNWFFENNIIIFDNVIILQFFVQFIFV